MTAIPPAGASGPGAGTNAPAQDPAAKLRKTSHQLEGVFLSYLFRAMRQTVPNDGLFAPSSGETMMTSMLDDEFAQSAAAHLHRGLGDALYKQLSHSLPSAAAAPRKP